MPSEAISRIALLGNPNAGKTSLFNSLTGLNQKTGNFPGVTVEKKAGYFVLEGHGKVELIDLPGTYSIFPKSFDEEIVFEFLTTNDESKRPDALVLVADVTNLRRNLFLFTQAYDLNIPVVLALSMVDIAEKDRSNIDLALLESRLGVPVVAINARKGLGIKELKEKLSSIDYSSRKTLLDVSKITDIPIDEIKKAANTDNPYLALTRLTYSGTNVLLNSSHSELALSIRSKIDSEELKTNEIVERYKSIDALLQDVVVNRDGIKRLSLSSKLDKILIHRVWGIVIFAILLLGVFQAVFTLAQYPMDWIDEGFAWLTSSSQNTLPQGAFFDLLTEGLLAGIGGVVIFIPQIAILFACLSLLEESGYMARVVYMMDNVMQRFGLNGRSVVPLVSGAACAIPAIMSARGIANWKERIITIFVTPLISCSARIPVYTILIALVIPEERVLGIFNLQGLTLFSLYLLGFLAAIGSAYAMKFIIKTREKSFFIMEFPRYKIPQMKNVVFTIYIKTRAFVFEAGKIIIAIATVLWVLASYGPGDQMNDSAERVREEFSHLEEAQLQKKVSAVMIENSYAGHLGKFIEPAIEPLGFNWKIGIALLTSFAAREVFVGTMATIYSIENDDGDNLPLKRRMAQELNPDSGEKFYNPAVGLSLMVFYAFAMQCMSTLAIVYRETNSWKWPMLQLVYMTALAYVSSLLVYNLFS
ncbi:MAG: ferrous iron transport protein B [Cytophagales bacterium]